MQKDLPENENKYSYCIKQDCLHYATYTVKTSMQAINHICLRCRHFNGFDMYEKKDAEKNKDSMF